MTVKTTKTPHDRKPAAGIADIPAIGPEHMARLGTAWFREINDLGPQLARFMAERIEEDAKFGRRVMHSKDLVSLHRAQTDFVRTAVEHYAAESGRIASLGGAILGEAFAAPRPRR